VRSGKDDLSSWKDLTSDRVAMTNNHGMKSPDGFLTRVLSRNIFDLMDDR